MNRQWILTITIFGLLIPQCIHGQHHSSFVDDCTSCRSADQHGDQPYYDDTYQGGYSEEYYDEGVYDGYANHSRAYRTPVRNVAGNIIGRTRGRLANRFGGRFGGQGLTYGREGDSFGAPFIDGECGDCNWGPFYLSIFAGVGFVDNVENRNTFDNGMDGFLGIQENSFSTLDGVTTGGSIGRYFYRQARAEFEYTFRDNGIGEMGTEIFSDDLSTTQINDTLVSSSIVNADGNMESNSFMFNIVADLRPRTVGCVSAYLGGGLGVLYVDSDIETAAAQFDINDSTLAFQGIIGINLPTRDAMDLYAEYRYLGADSINVDRTDAMGTQSLGSFQFDSHSLVFGMRLLRR